MNRGSLGARMRDRLREVKGIDMPATRAEVIRSLRAKEFLVLAGKHVGPTERGLALFGVFEQASPALVDPGVTAQLKLLLDEVLVGSQEMNGAVDAVCAQVLRIIDRLIDGLVHKRCRCWTDRPHLAGRRGARRAARVRCLRPRR